MAKRKWKKGLTSKQLKEKDEQKGQRPQAAGDRVSYFIRGIIKQYIPKVGKNKIRIIQPLEVEELGFYGMYIYFHRDVGDKGEDLYGEYLCSSRMKAIFKKCYDMSISGDCFICNQQTSELWDTNFDLAKTYYPDERVWFWIQDLLADDKDEVYLWSCAWTLHEEIVSRSSSAETSVYVDVSDPVLGVPVSFEKQGERYPNIKYMNVQIFTEPWPLKDEIIDQLIEFRELVVLPEYDIVKAAHLNISVDDVTGDDPALEEKAKDVVQNEDDEPECFRKEYDKWSDCENCKWAEECAKKPEEKPQRSQKPSRSSQPKQDQPDGEKSAEEKKEAIREKIRETQLGKKGEAK